MRDEKKEIKIADLFGGVGGFRLGIERATNKENREIEQQQQSKGANIRHNRNKLNTSSSRGRGRENKRDTTYSCVFYSEIDKYAVQTYNKNFKENHKPTDITNIRAEDIPDFDILCGGFPCQAFSIAGKRRGFQDTRGTLFFEIARIIKTKRPKIVFLENVKGLLNHENGKTFSIIIQTISELGYNVQWMVLNSKFFGVPQNRERVFIIGSLREEPRPEILPFRKINEINNQKQQEQTARTLTSSYHKQGQWEQYIMDLYNNKIHSDRSPTLTEPHHNTLRVVSATKKGYSEAEAGDGIRLEYPQSKTARGRVIKQNSNTLKSGTEGVLTTDMKIRKLTPIECERLQGFPDNWTEGVSDTQRYKQMGNAVTVNVIEAIARKLI
jgi:DNA (cytosine-5)-methyltransferase 1